MEEDSSRPVARMSKVQSRHVKVLSIPAAIFLCCLALLIRDYRQEAEGGPADQKPLATIVTSRGDVKRKPPTRMLWFEAKTEQSLYRKDTVRTADGSTSTIRLASGGTIELAENSLIVIEQGKKGIAVDFLGGSVQAHGSGSGVTFRSKGVEIDTGKADVKLQAGKTGEVELDVQKGTVQVGRGGITQTLSENQKGKVTASGLKEVQTVPTRLIAPRSGELKLSRAGANVEAETVEFKYEIKRAVGAVVLEVAQDGAFGRIEKSLTLGSPQPGVFTQRLELPQGRHHWRLREEVGASGGPGAVAETWSFELRSVDEPRLLSPAPGVSLALGKEPARQRFSWQMPPFLDRTRLEIARDSAFRNIEQKQKLDGQTSSEIELADPGRFFWRVVGVSEGGENPVEVASAPREFKVEKWKVAAPDLISPREQASLIVQEEAPQVSFRWSEAKASIPDAPRDREYRVEVARDPGFESVVTKLDVTDTSTNWEAKQELGSLYWRVQAREPGGEWSTPSAPRGFVLVSGMPVGTKSPAERSTHSFEGEPKLELNWEKVTGAVGGYQVQLSRDSHFEKGSTWEINAQDASAQVASFKPPSGPTEWIEGLYFWRIRALDKAGKPFRSSSVASFELKAKDILPPPVLGEHSPAGRKLANLPGKDGVGPPSEVRDPTLGTEDREFTLQWPPVEGAVDYQIEVRKDQKVVQDQIVQGTQWRTKWLEGNYTYRVRARSPDGKKGRWSDPGGFAVAPKPPDPVYPKPQEVIAEKLPEEGVKLTWKGREPVGQKRFVIQLSNSEGWEQRKEILPGQPSQLDWKPKEPGLYKWRVASLMPDGRLTGGDYSEFKIDSNALESNVKAESLDDIETERPPEWWIIGRYAQALSAYNSLNRDTSLAGSGAAIVSQGNLELRFRARKEVGQIYTLSGALNVEVLQRSILGSGFTLPRANVRVFVSREFERWRIGPFVQVGVGMSNIYILTSSISAIQAVVLRQNVGVGAFTTYRFNKRLMLSGILMPRVDFGGSSSILPNALVPTFGIEGGFGVGVSLTDRLAAEARFRVIQETQAWRPASTTATSLSSLSDLSVLVDLGLGWRF